MNTMKKLVASLLAFTLTACGFQLRDEVSEGEYTTGTVGLAKAGPDTGSCQLFITLAPTPHLEGRYTIVGRVVSGMDVVQRLELGSVVTKATAR